MSEHWIICDIRCWFVIFFLALFLCLKFHFSEFFSIYVSFCIPVQNYNLFPGETFENHYTIYQESLFKNKCDLTLKLDYMVYLFCN